MMSLVAFAIVGLSAPDPGYVVVIEESLTKHDHGPNQAQDHDLYVRAAAKLQAAHNAVTQVWDLSDAGLATMMATLKPHDVVFVLDPRSIDANFPRRVVPILAAIDDDPFVDCRFGIVTGATGADAERFVDTILDAAKTPRKATKVEATSVVVDRCARLASKKDAGHEGRALETTSLWVTGKDAEWREFLAKNRASMSGAGLVEWGHCGDSQGIWLFSMYRNRDGDKHWQYDPAKVGQDPNGEMPRMTPATLLDGVSLGGAIVLNGSCHSAVTRRTMVGPDIVSTFGDTNGKVHFFDIQPEESFTLQAIAHGASAYIAPLGANNANRAAIEEWWIRRGGVSLGEVMRRVYGELVMGAMKLPLSFALYADGKDELHEPPMFADTVQRVLFGDPSLVAWPTPIETPHRVVTSEKDGVLTVDVTWTDSARDPWIWDPWIEKRSREEQGRIYEIVPLSTAPTGEPRVTVISAESTRAGESKPLALEARALVEIDPDRKPMLHLKASGTRKAMTPLEPKERPDTLHARFEVRFGDAK